MQYIKKFNSKVLLIKLSNFDLNKKGSWKRKLKKPLMSVGHKWKNNSLLSRRMVVINKICAIEIAKSVGFSYFPINSPIVLILPLT